MALIDKLAAIADAIREKTGTSVSYDIDGMIRAIGTIPSSSSTGASIVPGASNYAITTKLSSLGNAIRAKTGGQVALTLDEMPAAIRGITYEEPVDGSEGLVYWLSDEEDYYYVVSYGDCTDIDVIVPSVYKGLPVKGVYQLTNSNITSVTLPDSITFISSYAFDGNTNLTSITFGSGISHIYHDAFSDTGLTDVYIKDLTAWCGIENDLSNMPSHNLYVNNELITNLVIPDGIIEIGTGAFQSCNLTSVTFPDSVTTIGSYSFAETLLTNVIIPDTITTISGSAFSGSSLTSVTFGNSVTSIGQFAFTGTALTRVLIPESVTNIGTYAFADIDSINHITICGTPTMEESAFGAISAINTLAFTKTLGSVSSTGMKNAFSGSNIQALYMAGASDVYSNWGANDVTEIYRSYIFDGLLYEAGSGFYSIEDIGIYEGTDVVIPDTYNELIVRDIGTEAFRGCTNITSVTIGNNVEYIHRFAFKDCPSLTDIYIPKAEGAIADAPWGADETITTIHYNYTA